MFTDFQQQVILVILDKLLIGILIAVAGYIANRSIERYRRRQAFLSFAASKRLDAIGEAWLQIYQLDYLCWQAINKVKAIHNKKGVSKEVISSTISKQIKMVKGEVSRILKYLSENRFWLGEDAHSQYVSYVFALDELVNKFIDEGTVDVSFAQSKLKSLREDVLAAIQSKYI